MPRAITSDEFNSLWAANAAAFTAALQAACPQMAGKRCIKASKECPSQPPRMVIAWAWFGPGDDLTRLSADEKRQRNAAWDATPMPADMPTELTLDLNGEQVLVQLEHLKAQAKV